MAEFGIQDQILRLTNKPMSLDKEIRKILKELGPGSKSITAYDTAWVARLGEIDWDMHSTGCANISYLMDHGEQITSTIIMTVLSARWQP